MIFSESFINVLSTFYKINPGMFFRVGTIQDTIGTNSGKLLTFFCRAYTDVDIPESFVLGDIGKLLAVLRMFKTPPELNIVKNTLVIEGDNRQVTFNLVVPKFVPHCEAPEKIKMVPGHEAVLTSTNINDILSLYTVFSPEHITFAGRDGKFQVIVSTVANGNAPTDQGIIELGDTDGEFSAVIQAANFRIEKTKSNEDYKIVISKNGVVFIGNKTFEYFIPCEAKHSHI